MGNMGAVEFSPASAEMVEYVTIPKSGSDVVFKERAEVGVNPSAPVVAPTKVIVEAKEESGRGLGRYLPYLLAGGLAYYLLFMNKK